MCRKRLYLEREPTRRFLLTDERTADEVIPELRQLVNKLVRGEKPWPLFLYGHAGRGKTCAALCLLDRVRLSHYRTEDELCEDAKLAGQGKLYDSSGNKTTPRELWRTWQRMDLVTLDEAGRRLEVSDHHRAVVQRALDERSGLPAVFISNEPLVELVTRYLEPICSRLRGGTIYELVGPDRRLVRTRKDS